MKRICIAPIVEGHGDVAAVPILLRRLWMEYLGADYVEVLRPFRDKRNRLAEDKNSALSRAVQFSWSRLLEYQNSETAALILVLLDADNDPPCELGPNIVGLAKAADSRADIACIIAKVEFETWFVAAAASLSSYLRLPAGTSAPTKPEGDKLGKGWIVKHFVGAKYSETIDQPRMAAAMDLGLCRSQSPSFDKLCRDLEIRLRA